MHLCLSQASASTGESQHEQLLVFRMLTAAVLGECLVSRPQMVCPGLSSRKLGNWAAALLKVRLLLRFLGSPLCYLPGLPQKLFSALIRGDNTQKDTAQVLVIRVWV